MNTKYLLLWLFVYLSIISPTAAQQSWLPELTDIGIDPLSTQALARIGNGIASDIVWSPDGSIIAVASSVGVWLYDAANIQAEPQLIEIGTRGITFVAFSPDGAWLAIASDQVYIWDIAENHRRQTIDLGANVTGLAFSPDGTQLVTSHGYISDSYEVIVWDIATSAPALQMERRGAFVNLTYSPDGTYIAGVQLGDCCFNAIIWDAATGAEVYSGDIEGYGADEDIVIFSPDSTTLAVVDRTGGIVLWDLATNNPRAILPITDTASDDRYPSDAVFTADGTQFMTLSKRGILRIWDTTTYQLIETRPTGNFARVAGFSPDFTQIAGVGDDQQFFLADFASGDITDQSDFITIRTPNVVFNPDGSRLAFTVNNDIWLWDMVSGERAAVLSGHDDDINDLTFNPANGQLASASSDGTVRFWNVESADLVETFITLDTNIRRIIFDQYGGLLIATDSTIQVYDLASHQPLALFYDPATSTNTDTLSPMHMRAIVYDGNQIVVSSSRSLNLWQRGSQVGLREFTTFSFLDYGGVNALAFNTQYGWLIGGGDNNVVMAWSMQDSSFVAVVTTHNSWVYDIAINNDQNLVASVGCGTTTNHTGDGSLACFGADLRLRALDDILPAPMIIPQGHTAVITSVVFNPANTLLATASDDGTIILWGVPATANS